MSSAGISVEQLITLGFIAVAMVLGGVIGFERELADKPAGIRTHMLVAGAAALLVSLGTSLVEWTDQELSGQLVRADPIRIIEAVITGVSFLGAGTIIREHRHRHAVEGLTTAACLLVTAAVGVATALRELTFAVGTTALVLLTLRVVHWVERRMVARREGMESS